MTAAFPEYEIYAIRYATRDALRRDHFIGGDPHESPMPMDYFVWCIIGKAGAINGKQRHNIRWADRTRIAGARKGARL